MSFSVLPSWWIYQGKCFNVLRSQTILFIARKPSVQPGLLRNRKTASLSAFGWPMDTAPTLFTPMIRKGVMNFPSPEPRVQECLIAPMVWRLIPVPEKTLPSSLPIAEITGFRSLIGMENFLELGEETFWILQTALIFGTGSAFSVNFMDASLLSMKEMPWWNLLESSPMPATFPSGRMWIARKFCRAFSTALTEQLGGTVVKFMLLIGLNTGV